MAELSDFCCCMSDLEYSSGKCSAAQNVDRFGTSFVQQPTPPATPSNFHLTACCCCHLGASWVSGPLLSFLLDTDRPALSASRHCGSLSRIHPFGCAVALLVNARPDRLFLQPQCPISRPSLAPPARPLLLSPNNLALLSIPSQQA